MAKTFITAELSMRSMCQFSAQKVKYQDHWMSRNCHMSGVHVSFIYKWQWESACWLKLNYTVSQKKNVTLFIFVIT